MKGFLFLVVVVIGLPFLLAWASTPARAPTTKPATVIEPQLPDPILPFLPGWT